MLSLTPGLVAAASALTADEVLQLRQAGVSDATIQQMLENERMKDQQQQADAPSAAMEQDKFANDHIGTWTNSEGRVVLSTGKADPQKDVFDPTVQNSNGDYGQSNVYPYVFPGRTGRPGRAGARTARPDRRRRDGSALSGAHDPPCAQRRTPARLLADLVFARSRRGRRTPRTDCTFRRIARHWLCSALAAHAGQDPSPRGRHPCRDGRDLAHGGARDVRRASGRASW